MLFWLGVHPVQVPRQDGGGYPFPGQGGTPSQVRMRGYYHPANGGYSLIQVPDQDRRYPFPGQDGAYAPVLTWEGVPLSLPGRGTPRCELTQTENITFPHPMDAGGKN